MMAEPAGSNVSGIFSTPDNPSLIRPCSSSANFSPLISAKATPFVPVALAQASVKNGALILGAGTSGCVMAWHVDSTAQAPSMATLIGKKGNWQFSHDSPTTVTIDVHRPVAIVPISSPTSSGENVIFIVVGVEGTISMLSVGAPISLGLPPQMKALKQGKISQTNWATELQLSGEGDPEMHVVSAVGCVVPSLGRAWLALVTSGGTMLIFDCTAPLTFEKWFFHDSPTIINSIGGFSSSTGAGSPISVSSLPKLNQVTANSGERLAFCVVWSDATLHLIWVTVSPKYQQRVPLDANFRISTLLPDLSARGLSSRIHGISDPLFLVSADCAIGKTGLHFAISSSDTWAGIIATCVETTSENSNATNFRRIGRDAGLSQNASSKHGRDGQSLTNVTPSHISGPSISYIRFMTDGTTFVAVQGNDLLSSQASISSSDSGQGIRSLRPVRTFGVPVSAICPLPSLSQEATTPVKSPVNPMGSTFGAGPIGQSCSCVVAADRMLQIVSVI